jgi:hypothetical protein
MLDRTMPDDARPWRTGRNAAGGAFFVLFVLLLVTSGAGWVRFLLGLDLLAIGLLMAVDWKETMRLYTRDYEAWGITMPPGTIRWLAAVSAATAIAVGVTAVVGAFTE